MCLFVCHLLIVFVADVRGVLMKLLLKNDLNLLQAWLRRRSLLLKLNFTTVGSNPHRLTISTQVRSSSCWIAKVCQHVYLLRDSAQVVTHSSQFSLKPKIVAERSNADFPTFREIRQLEAEARLKNY